jgi:hypothetical protein
MPMNRRPAPGSSPSASSPVRCTIPAALGALLQRAAAPSTVTVLPEPATTQATPAAGTGAPASNDRGRGKGRARLWTLDRKFHCPIVGTCIDATDLARLARRLQFDAATGQGLAADYRRHVEAVGYCGSRNSVSEAIQRHLDQRFAAALHVFATARSEAAVIERWQECLARGEVAGPFWATVTHRHAGDEARAIAYGSVHMLSHQVGSGLAADVRRTEFLEQDNTRLRLELAGARAALARRAEIDEDAHRALRAEMQTMRDEQATLLRDRARLHELESGIGMIALARRLMALTDENRALQGAAARSDGLAERLAKSQREALAVRAHVERLQGERRALEKLLDSGTDAAAPDAAVPDGDCAGGGDCLRCAEANKGLSRERCILCVGGRTSLLSHYRALADRLGIRLLHHDGGLEEALSRLPELIARDDAVLCPTDCVGHAAYYSLKQQCRKIGKPCLLFKGAGVTSFAFALSRVSAGESSLPSGDLLQNSTAGVK